MTYVSLDVGCGVHFRGDVNCDLYYEPLSRVEGTIIPNRIPNFVLCDAQHLPFIDNAFSVVYCFHTIEHVTNPLLLLKELVRVGKDTIEVRCPHRYSPNARKGPYHLHLFSTRWFEQNLKRLGIPYDVETRMRGFPSKYLPLVQMPDEIVVHIHKRWTFTSERR